ncbi:MAG: APC family permease [Candidatus Ancillula sp.]|jgi:amino acid transporter|nr:APC family permease [Candidatus Ancillula sp.]
MGNKRRKTKQTALSLYKKIRTVLLGRTLKNDEGGKQELTKLQALAMLSSDALSSVAYGTEQIVLVLITVSSAAIWWSVPIALGVLVLLFSLVLSYRQVIKAYPQGGGAYVVSSENLGTKAGLIAGGSLLIDYMLTVAVSVTAGAEAIISVLPGLHDHKIFICNLIIILLCLMNLRGAQESAGFLMLPVYLFVVVMFLMIGVGVGKIFLGMAPYTATAAIGQAVPGVSIALLLRSFSSGSASLTGVEAISNAVPVFKNPKAKNAAATLAFMGIILGIFFAGVTFLNYWYGVVPADNVTLLSQVGLAVFGNNILYYIMQFATAAILAVAANTGFSAFPMLGFNLAKDKYMPHIYKEKGTRLGFSSGIITLAVGAALLIVLFQGDTTKLIPLYSIGVFIPFTLAQTGMVVKWCREKPKGWINKATSNIVGALISFAIIIILFVFRLADIWPFFFIMPALLFLFYQIHSHYKEVAKELRLTSRRKGIRYEGNIGVVLIGNVTVVDQSAIDYARSISEKVVALHVDTGEDIEKSEEIKRDFSERFRDIDLVIAPSPERSITEPVVKYVKRIANAAKSSHKSVTVIIPQFVPKHRWQNMLHNQTALKIRIGLADNDNIIIAETTMHLKK